VIGDRLNANYIYMYWMVSKGVIEWRTEKRIESNTIKNKCIYIMISLECFQRFYNWSLNILNRILLLLLDY